jgi:hypothetical protein
MTDGEMKLKWISEELPEDLRAAEQQIRNEIMDMDMDDPMDLLFHTVFLTKDMDGPSVFVHPSDDREHMVCSYSAKTEWIAVDFLDDDDTPRTLH